MPLKLIKNDDEDTKLCRAWLAVEGYINFIPNSNSRKSPRSMDMHIFGKNASLCFLLHF